MKTIKQRRIKVGTQYWATGYGRNINTKNIYLIDDKCFAYHPKYADQSFKPLNGDFKGYIPVNYDKGFNTFHQIDITDIHNNFKNQTKQQTL